MITLRSKKTKSDKYSLYLDYNTKYPCIGKDGNLVFKRKLEYLHLYVSKDYTSGNQHLTRRKIAAKDKEAMILAEEVLCKRRREVLLGNHNMIEDLRKEGDFIEFFEEQMESYPEKRNSSYKGALYHLRAFTKGQLKFKELDSLWLERFKRYLLNRASNTTTCIYLDRLRIIFNIALRMKIIRETPFDTLKKPQKDTKPTVFLIEDELRLLTQHQSNIDSEVIQAFLFSCYTGLRYSDLETLKWQEVDSEMYYSQKTKKMEDLVLNDQSRRILDLQRQKSTNQLVFTLRNDSYYNRHLKKWALQANLNKHITSHVGRHTCATLLAQKGVDIYTISKILGHSSIKMTERYLHILKADKEEAVSMLPDFEINYQPLKTKNI